MVHNVVLKYCLIALLINTFGYSITLDEAIKKAIFNDKELKSNIEKKKSAKRETKIQRGAYYPTLNMSYTLGDEKTATPGNLFVEKNLNSSNLFFEGKINLFSGLNTYYGVKEKEVSEFRSELVIEQRISRIASDLVKNYLNILEAKDRLTFIKKTLEINESYLEKIDRQRALGIRSDSDFFQIKAKFSGAKIQELVAMQDLDKALNTFEKLTGEKPKVESFVYPVIEDNRFQQKEILEKKLFSNNLDILLAKLDIKKNSLQRKQSFSKFSPEVDIILTKTISENIHGVEAKDDSEKIFLQMKYNFFNGLQDYNKLQVDKHKLFAKQYDLAHVQENIKEKLDSLNINYEIFSQQVELLKEQREHLMMTRIHFENEFDLNKKTLIDLLNLELEINQVNQNYETIKINKLRKYYEILEVIGEINSYFKIAMQN